MADTAGSAKAYAQSGRDRGFEAMVPGTSQIVTIQSTSTQSNNLSVKASIARLFSTQDCYLAFNGSNPAVVGSSGYFLPGGIIDFVGLVHTQEICKIAVIWSGTNGLLYVTEGA